MLRQVYRPNVLSWKGVREGFASLPLNEAPRSQELALAPSCQASEVPGRVANLCTTRGVIRMAGTDVLTFLQAMQYRRHFAMYAYKLI